MSVELELRFWRHVEALHRCGPRATGELLLELGAQYMIVSSIEMRLAAYAERLDPAMLRALGGDKPPPVPLHEVQK